MEFYLLIFVLCVYFMMRKSDTAKNRTRFIYIITITLLLLSGLRHQYVGADTVNYLNNFDTVHFLNWGDVFGNFVTAYLNPDSEVGKDPAIQVLNLSLSIFFSDHVVYLTIIAALFLVPLALFFKRNARSLDELLFSYAFFIALYYCYLPNSAVRQTIAAAFVLLGCLLYQRNNKRLIFFLLILLGSLFHKSALLCVLLLGATYIKNFQRFYKCGILLFIIMLFIYEHVGLILSSSSEIYSMYSGAFYANRNRPFIVLVLFAGLYAISLFNAKKTLSKMLDKSQQQLIVAGSLLTISFVSLILLDPSLIRITGFFFFWFILFVSQSIETYSSGTRSVIYWTCILLFVYKTFKSGVDYAFFWQYMQPHSL